MAVQAGSDRGTAERDLVQAGQGGLQTGDPPVQLRDVAAEFLAERERHGILEVRSADLDDGLERLPLRLESIAQGADARDEVLDDRRGDGHVERRRERVVAGLAAVDVVVGVDRLLATPRAGGQLIGPAGDDLVDVHVRLRARAGLPDP